MSVKHELTVNGLASRKGTVDDKFTASVIARDQYGNVVDVDRTLSLKATSKVLIPGDDGKVEGGGNIAMRNGQATATIQTKVPGTISLSLDAKHANVDETDTATITVLQGNVRCVAINSCCVA